MPAYKNKDNGTWYVMTQYTNWKGERKPKCKRGFGISLVPAILTIIGVCRVRIAWIAFVFTNNQTFQTILTAYPVSLSATAVMIAIALFCYHPIKRFKEK